MPTVFLILSLVLPAAQSDGFVSIFDGTLDGWTIENSTPEVFGIRNGLLHVEGAQGWLRSENQYSDFLLRAQFRFLSDDTDSGIYVRAVADSEFIRGWPNNSYQVQVRNPIGESRFGPVGDLFRHGTPDGAFDFDPAVSSRASTGTGEWQTIEIEAVGDTLTVRLNGTQLSRAANIVNPTGYIGIQSEVGPIEFRSIEILER
jgi:3-keto-disaccharide hydrolase